jgi:hypothetical protein
MERIGKKSDTLLEPGYVFAPYIVASSNVGVIVESKQITRMRKLNKIYKKDREIKGDIFSPSKSIQSRYAKKIVNNNFYGVVTVK